MLKRVIKKLFFQIAASLLGFWLAKEYIPHVEIQGDWKNLLKIGITAGVIFTFLKPPLKILTFPLRILTLGTISIILNMAIIWFLDIIFQDLVIIGFLPLFLSTLLIAFLLGLTNRLQKS